jgi:hypothetical protein
MPIMGILALISKHPSAQTTSHPTICTGMERNSTLISHLFLSGSEGLIH